MDLREFDLKRFREERLKLTQEGLAKLLDMRQDQVSRLEKNPADMSLDRFLQLCDVAQMTPNQLLNYKLKNPDPLPLVDPYADIRRRRMRLEQYLEPWRAQLQAADDALFIKANEQLSDFEQVVRTYTAKPLLAFLGRSDAGKSRMINALTGTSQLPAEWQPTTSIRVYVKHIADKPSWMDEPVWVFKKPAPDDPGWDFRRFADEEYCNAWKLEAGSTDVLHKYGTRQGNREIEQEAGAAVVFVDAPILLGCDIVDLPGFGTGDREEDEIEAQRGREQADAVVYLSPANSFMNAEDITFIKHVIRDLPPVELDGTAPPALANLLVVASQAHIPAEEDLETILQTGAERVYHQVPAEVWAEKTAITGRQYTLTDFQQRFYTYTLDNGQLRLDLERALSQLLQEYLPGVWRHRVHQAINAARRKVLQYYDHEVARIKSMPHQREEVSARLEEIRRYQPELQAKLDSAKQAVYTEIGVLSHETRLKFEFWYGTYITPDTIEAIIRERKYTKRQAQEYIGGNLNDMIYTKVRTLLEQATTTLGRQVQHYLDTFDQGVTELSAVSIPGAQIPFDTKGALAGGLAAATVLGGFGVWAGSLGNIGTSILVAKGVSLLGAFGLVGSAGGAIANAMISAVADPVAFAVSMAVGLGLLMKWALGDKWQTRLGRRLYEAIKEQDVVAQYSQAIETYWADTKEGFRQVTQRMEDQVNAEIAAQERLLAEDSGSLERLLARTERIRDMFAGICWETEL
ncbi:MAG TPA: helix-turn-helix domain-containing protein [Firmicutes bacterium]|nr:helix-turn-helix domain-containing protein [Bacillota bacterium]